MKVVSRAKNSNNKFRSLSKGAGAGQQMGSILSKLKAGADKEAKEAKDTKEESKRSFVKAVKAWLQATVAQKQQHTPRTNWHVFCNFWIL